MSPWAELGFIGLAVVLGSIAFVAIRMRMRPVSEPEPYGDLPRIPDASLREREPMGF